MKNRLIAIILCTAALLPTLTAGAGKEAQMSETQLNITEKLGEYDEAIAAQRLADKDADSFIMAENGGSEVSIVVADSCSESVSEAAGELQKYLNLMLSSEGLFPIVSESEYSTGRCIAIGSTALSEGVDCGEISDDGYLIKIEKDKILLLALSDEALLNGVYGFLEDKLELMFVREDYDYVPHFDTVYLKAEEIVSNPDFAWRKVFQYEAAQNGWYKKLRCNGVVADAIEKNALWGTWCHTSFTFVPPEEYMQEHPEYFTYDENGEPQQLCLSNEEIYPIIEAKMARLIQEQPDKIYWDFSINDNQNYCKCEKCAEVLAETGSMMGTMLPIINRLARRFPDKIISTLAYFFNEQPPKGMTCEENVNIVLAPIVSGQLYSYRFGASEKAAKTKSLVESWGDVSHSLMIWDYVINFAHLLLPYPNYDVQKDNHILYMENNVRAVFHQGSREQNDEMARLRTYILSRQLWDNDIDISLVLAKYIKVTYGSAARYVAEYLDAMNAELKNGAEDLDLYDSPESHAFDYLSLSAIRRYDKLTLSALEAADDERIKYYVEEIRINALYAIMYEPGLNYLKKKKAFAEFSSLVQEHSIDRHTEVGEDMQSFISATYPEYLSLTAKKLTAACVVPTVSAGLIALACILLKKKGFSLKAALSKIKKVKKEK